MKRLSAILLALLLLVTGTFSVAAAQPQQEKTAYVSSRLVPKEVVAYAQDWFSKRIPVQDICDYTKLTVDQVKKVKLCRPFTVELLEGGAADRDAGNSYYFPLLYENKFVGTLGVGWSEKYGYSNFMLGGDSDSFSKGLNSLPSAFTSPIMFVFTDNGTFALDSRNKVTLLRDYWNGKVDTSEEIKKDKLAIAKIKRPTRIINISAETAYPDKPSTQPLADEEPVLTVKNETENIEYKSYDGGKTWVNNLKPPMYISVDKTYFPRKDGRIPYTVHNNTKNEQYTDVYFKLQKWNGLEWVKIPKLDELDFIDIALIISPENTALLTASWGASGIKLGAGRYKLIKKLSANNRQFTCETVVCLVD